MRKFNCESTFVTKRRSLQNGYFTLTFGPLSAVSKCRPGHFLHIRLPESRVFFRRAMSVAAIDKRTRELEIIFKVVGRGTSIMSSYRRGSRIEVLAPLGTPFKLPGRKETTLLVGGGIGFPPLLYLASDMVQRGYDPGSILFFYGGRSLVDILERGRIRKLGVDLRPVTEDGSFGQKGLVTQWVDDYILSHPEKRMRIFACGPEPMLKAVDALGLRHGIPGQLSLEAPMPCGIGVCLGCVVSLRSGGYARVCREGPVFDIGEVVL